MNGSLKSTTHCFHAEGVDSLPDASGPSEGKSTADVLSFLWRFVLTQARVADADSFYLFLLLGVAVLHVRFD